MIQEQLVAQAATGNRLAMEDLAKCMYPQVYRFFIKLSRSPEEAQDLSQMAMIRMMENLHKYRAKQNAKFVSWLFTLCYHLFIDQTRKKKPVPTEDSILHAIPDGVDAYSQSVQKQEIAQLLRSLPEDMRSMVVLRYYVGLGHEEIATVVGCSAKRVKWKLHDALEKMRIAAEEVS